MDRVTIAVKRKNVYGNELIYVCDQTHANIIRQLTGKKTVAETDIELLKMLGVDVRDIDAEIKQLINA